MSHAEMCNIIRIMAITAVRRALAFPCINTWYCAAIWKIKHQRRRRAAAAAFGKRTINCWSAPAPRDWLESMGKMEKAEGGYLFPGRNFLPASRQVEYRHYQCTLAGYRQRVAVLHFGVSMKLEGVSQSLDDCTSWACGYF